MSLRRAEFHIPNDNVGQLSNELQNTQMELQNAKAELEAMRAREEVREREIQAREEMREKEMQDRDARLRVLENMFSMHFSNASVRCFITYMYFYFSQNILSDFYANQLSISYIHRLDFQDWIIDFLFLKLKAIKM